MADSPARTTSGAPGGTERRSCGIVHRTTSESLRLGDLVPATSLQVAAPVPASAQQQHNPRKISSFQITSVTVGGRVSTDAGEDSADDLDESHADDISRITDLDNETPSRSEDTFSRDDVFYNASASHSLGSAPVIPTSSQYGLAIVGQEGPDATDMRVASGATIVNVADTKPQEGAKEIQENVRNERFKVVKIESTEPFRRGRWTCMDYLDHTTIQQSAPLVLNNNLESTDNNTLTADSGVVINDIQHDDCVGVNDLTNKDLGLVSVLQIEHNIKKSFPIASPGQSLTQPINLVPQQMAAPQPVSVQSPPLEVPQQMSSQSLQTAQQHPQSMTHITLQQAPQSHAPPTQQPQPVQQMPQSFPQHQLQQVIAQSQGMPQMQQMTMHQQIPQQMQQIQNQAQMQQLPSQHITQNQMPNMQQMPPQISQMQTMQNQNQMQVQNQQSMQQIQMQQMQAQSNPQQLHQMQQPQMTNMTQATHHLQQSQAMGSQQPQLQHMTSQAQLQAMQTQQLSNHIPQMQLTGQVTQMAGAGQQLAQMQTQMHQMSAQSSGGQQQVVPSMHQQMQQGMSGVQQQYAQSVSQQPNSQAMINPGLQSSQQAMVSQQHSVPQYHTQQSQMSQQGQTLPQEVLTSIASSHQANNMTANLQSLPSQPPGSTLPSNLQSMSQQNAIHQMAQQPQSMPQGTIQMMANTQNMPMSLETNQAGMQMPVSDAMYMQTPNVNQQLQMSQHMSQAQNMMTQQVSTSAQNQQHLTQQSQLGGMQYVMPQQQMPNQANVVSQANMQNVNQGQGNVQSIGQQIPGNMGQQAQPSLHGMVNPVQNMPMSIQQTLPVSLQGGVHTVATSVVQSQTNMQPSMQAPGGLPIGGYGSQGVVNSLPQNVMPAMSHTSISQPVGIQSQQIDPAAMSSTSSPVVSLAVSSGVYPTPHAPNAMDGQNFGSPVSAVMSHVVNSSVNSSVGGEGGALEVNEATTAGTTDAGDGRADEAHQPGAEEESISGLAMALGGSGSGSPGAAADQQCGSGGASRPPSPSAGATAGDRQPHHANNASASGTSAVAIDNKIEQAMDLVKSHLMFAVREEVEVLKERIAELMERITQLEVENTYLRAHASQDTLAQLPAAGAKPAALPPAGPPPPAS